MTRSALALFFSHGVGLGTWRAGGLLSREIGYYRELAREIGPVTLVTYDTPRESLSADVDAALPLRVLCNRWRLPYQLFGVLAPFIHYRALSRARVLKTNQLSGAWAGVISKWLTRRPLVVRCGFVRSRNAKLRGVRGFRLRLIEMVERFTVRSADRLFVATELDRDYISARHGIELSRFRHVPTPIDVERFSPGEELRERGHVIYVGRLTDEKNVGMIIDACREVPDARLSIVGTGPLEEELRARAGGGNVEFLGLVPNEELPKLLRKCHVFVLASSYEGSPKALLEAMACGTAPVASDIPAVRVVIEDRREGLVVPLETDAIAAAVRELIQNPELAAKLGRAARQRIVANYSMRSIAQTEAAYLEELAG